MTNETELFPANNTDKELWCTVEGDYYSKHKLYVTEKGWLTLCEVGHCVSMPPDQWFALATTRTTKHPDVEAVARAIRDAIRDAIRECAGGHSLTNGKGDNLWHTVGAINLNYVAKAAISAMNMGDSAVATGSSDESVVTERTQSPATDLWAVVEDALKAAPVYVTEDGTWLNFRPDAHRSKGGAMIKVEMPEAEAIRNYGEKTEAARTAFQQLKERFYGK